MTIIERLFELQDIQYKAFHQKLIPTVNVDTIIGIRLPILRKLAKELYQYPEAKQFLKTLPHFYYEENNLHAFFIEQIKDFSLTMEETERFLPYIDNWATCDSFAPKIFKKYPDEVFKRVQDWIKRDHIYTVRYGIVTLLANYLDEYFNPEMLNLVANIETEEYYINMASAWYFSTALIKQYDATLPLLQKGMLSLFVHNKTIQKATESLRIDPETKSYLKQLKR